MSILDILIFVLTLVLLVVSHEFGHFFAAKKFGVKVLEFGFGLPPKVWGKVKGGTEYTINLLPIGGFVRLYGEDEVDKKALEAKDSFASQPVWERIGIVVAGVIMNLLVAVLIFYIILLSQGFTDKIPLIIPHQFFGANQTNESSVLVTDVAANSPAFTAGIKATDRISEVNGQKVDKVEDVISITKANAGNPVIYTLLDPSNAPRTVTATPRVNPPVGEGALGIGLQSIDMAVLRYETFPQKIFSGFSQAYNYSSYEFVVMGEIIHTAISEKNIQPVSESVAGPVGITKVAGDILSTGSPIIPYLNFMALISLSLAMFNILPIPALDGGRLFFLLIEAIFRKKVNATVEKYIHTAGMVLLLGLILVVTYSDIHKLIFPEPINTQTGQVSPTQGPDLPILDKQDPTNFVIAKYLYRGGVTNARPLGEIVIKVPSGTKISNEQAAFMNGIWANVQIGNNIYSFQSATNPEGGLVIPQGININKTSVSEDGIYSFHKGPNGIFAILTHGIKVGEYNSSSADFPMVIEKTKPDLYFSQAEIDGWKEILSSAKVYQSDPLDPCIFNNSCK